MAEGLKSSNDRCEHAGKVGPCPWCEVERLSAQWEKAARLLNEFRPVTGTDEWVAVRVGALNYVLMAASPTPAVGPLVAAPESRDG